MGMVINSHITVNRLNPGVSVVHIVSSSGWVQFRKELLLATDVPTTWAEVILRVKWAVFVSRWCYKSGYKSVEPNDRQGAVYKIKCSNCQASYIGETGRNLNMGLTEHKRATRNGDANNHIVVHHQLTNHNIDWDSAQCLTYSTNYFQQLTLESWYTNLEQMPLNRCQQLPAPYKQLIHDRNETDKRTSNRPT